MIIWKRTEKYTVLTDSTVIFIVLKILISNQNLKFLQVLPKSISVILLDIQMPVMNGYEAAKTIRSMDRKDAKAIPIIAMTANAFTEDRIRAKEAGMNEHVAKPVDVELLVKVIHKLVG